jgi:ADP-ribosylglycohydrolase
MYEFHQPFPPEPALKDRVRGCLLGGASGDALGAAVEFQRLPEILERFGSGGIRDLAPSFGRLGAITADTQLSLFTAEGLLRAAVLGATAGRADREACVQRSLLRWLKTQGETPPLEVPMDGWLVQLRPLHARRGPGLTCQSALRNLEVPGTPASNDSTGNGALTHIAPVGLVTPAAEAFAAGERIAALTHGHVDARLSAAVFASLIAGLLQGGGIDDALQAAEYTLQDRPGHEAVARALQQAVERANSGMPANAAAVESLGSGWVATEALAIALYSVMACDTFEEAVILAVNHSGDSDSTGALAGSLAGALFGAQTIPSRWTVDLELHTEMVALADDLHALATGTLDLASPATHERYPGS